MADFTPPDGPPPPKVPEGWVARWNDQYKEWFYVNTYTKKSQWEKPTEPAVNPAAADGPDGPPPSYTPGATPAPSDTKTNPFVNEATKPGGASSGPAESDEALARRLQEEENKRNFGGPSGGAAASYLNSPPPQQSQSPYPDNLPPRPGQGERGSDKAKGLLGKIFGSSGKQKYGSSSPFPGGHGSYGPPQQGGYYGGGPPPGQYGYGQPPYGQPQYGYGGGQGGYYGPPGGGYGGYPQQGRPGRSGGGMGMGLAGGAALGLGAGALIGGAIAADQIHDHYEEQQAYDQGYADGGGGGDDFGGGDFGGGDF